jgi:hypothetical protein
MGAGKTYIASFVTKKMGLRRLVIEIKSAIGSWKKVLLGVRFDCEEIFVKN